jgi:hypothetical protein
VIDVGTDGRQDGGMDFGFHGEIWYWRGPAPFHFVTVPADDCARLRSVAAEVTYGWGMIPVRARIGATEWQTSLFPKDGGYLLPVKDRVRRAENVDDGDSVDVHFDVEVRGGRPVT